MSELKKMIELKKKIRSLDADRAKEMLENIVVKCIFMGSDRMTSSEILTSITDFLEENDIEAIA